MIASVLLIVVFFSLYKGSLLIIRPILVKRLAVSVVEFTENRIQVEIMELLCRVQAWSNAASEDAVILQWSFISLETKYTKNYYNVTK